MKCVVSSFSSTCTGSLQDPRNRVWRKLGQYLHSKELYRLGTSTDRPVRQRHGDTVLAEVVQVQQQSDEA